MLRTSAPTRRWTLRCCGSGINRSRRRHPRKTTTCGRGRRRCSSATRFWAASIPPTTSRSGSIQRRATASACRSRWCRKGIARPAPLLLYGYGSYGSSTDPTFSADRLSLLDRGFVYAIAHVRGGQEMGRAWYDDGKLRHKKNTFTDFIDVADDLVRRGYTSPDRLFARGGSAGGLLMGAVVNMRPELFKGVIAGVPYVDVITTMMDASIPLTTGEYDEWGNPNDSTSYRYMLSYSPYDNVEHKAYPNLLITAGLHDSQVQYFEPAKWTARLRAMKTDNNRLILRTNMEAGHGGSSGRYRRWHDVAFEYAFLLDLAGLGDKPTP